MPRLLLATSNAGKVAELRDLLDGCGWELVAPADVGLDLDIEETGAGYLENATIKAEAFARAAGLPALADDSGLEVDALNGEPGPLHHLRGWDGGDQAERIRLLLRALEGVPPRRRTARFRAVIVVVLPDGGRLVEEGTCEGVIVLEPSGAEGFGYDPVFFVLHLGKTIAELSLAEKNRVSHRAVAAAKMRERLRQLANGTPDTPA